MGRRAAPDGIRTVSQTLDKNRGMGQDNETYILPERILAVMFFSPATIYVFLLLIAAFGSSAQEIITRDVCILGGGATGTYAAVQLIERGHSVVVVERENRLGGRSDTLYLPDGQYIDYGIRAYFKLQVVLDFLEQLNVDWSIYVPPAIHTDYINFQTGERVSNNNSVIDMVLALFRYRAAIQPFDYLSTGGYYLPDPVPEVLLRPFKEFVEEHDVAGVLRLLYTFSDPLSDVLGTPLLYVLQMFGNSQIDALLTGPMIHPKNGSNEIFRAAAERIGENNILYGTTAVNATRDSAGVELVVDRAGVRQTVRARQVLIAFAPLLPEIQGFDLDDNEHAVFSKLLHQNYYAAVVNSTGLPEGYYIYNSDPANEPGNLPTGDYQSVLDYHGVPGYYATRVVGGENFTQADAQQRVIDDLQRMANVGTFPIRDTRIVTIESHSPIAVSVPVDDVRNGFYRQLYALQGHRSTYYTGFTFCVDYSAQLWNYTLSIVDRMTAGLSRVDL
ncbi:hypothetical protein BDV19DRAFT_383692 [Aspergillus venezuelensis]